MTRIEQPPPRSARDLLPEAAAAGCLAPSVANSQPWRWRIHRDTLELRCDPARLLAAADPEGRLMVFSCGAAAHHASVALAVLGAQASMERVVDPADPDLLARFTITGRHEVTADDLLIHAALRRRRTDRRPFQGTEPVPEELLAGLRRTTAALGVDLHVFGRPDVGFLALAARAAGMIHGRDVAYQAEIGSWTTGHDPSSGDGVPATAAVAQVPRAVPVRDFAPGGEARLAPGPGDDEFTTFLALVTERDTREDWLRTGEASSAVLLRVTAEGLASSIMSDVIEVPGARALLRGLIDTSGYPQLMVRVGVGDSTPVPATPRRPSAEVIEVTGTE